MLMLDLDSNASKPPLHTAHGRPAAAMSSASSSSSAAAESVSQGLTSPSSPYRCSIDSVLIMSLGRTLISTNPSLLQHSQLRTIARWLLDGLASIMSENELFAFEMMLALTNMAS